MSKLMRILEDVCRHRRYEVYFPFDEEVKKPLIAQYEKVREHLKASRHAFRDGDTEKAHANLLLAIDEFRKLTEMIDEL